MSKNILGKRLKMLRKEQGVTQEMLASKLHVSRAVVAKWEIGIRNLKAEHAVALASYFGVTSDYLLGLSDDPAPRTAASTELQDDALLRQAICTFGAHMQKTVAIEELSELQKELCKDIRGDGDAEHIAEEIADVEIMLEQMKQIFHCKSNVEEWKVRKMLRLKKRIEEVTHNA